MNEALAEKVDIKVIPVCIKCNFANLLVVQNLLEGETLQKSIEEKPPE